MKKPGVRSQKSEVGSQKSIKGLKRRRGEAGKGRKIFLRFSDSPILRFVLFCVALLASHTVCSAENISFGISHADKKASPPAAAVYGEKIYVSYIREEGDVYLTALSADGKTLFAPVKINDKSSLANGIHQSPGLAVGSKGEIYVTWTSPRDGAEFAADLRLATSLDGGKTFSPSVVVNDNTTPSSRGFESITVDKDGVVYIAWLDGRDSKRDGKNDGSSAYFARSTNGGKNFEKNIRLDGNACPCCRTAVTAGPDGMVYISWRKVFEGDMRDMVVAGSSDSGKTFQQPVVVNHDQWVIQGCPHRGPSMAVDDKGALYYTWYTEGKEGFPAVYLSLSKDGGKTFTQRQLLPVGNSVFPDHPRLATGRDETVYIVWEEKTPVISKIMFASYQDSKGFSNPEQLSQGVRRSYEPVVLAVGDGTVYAAWVYDEIRFSKVVIKTIK